MDPPATPPQPIGYYVLLRIGGHRRDAKRVAFVKLDPLDYEWAKQYRWIIHDGTKTRYAKRAIYSPGDSDTRVRMHRELMGLPPNDPREVDHKNGDGLDNRRRNLRIVTKAENGANRTAPNRNASSQYRGVCWDERRQVWIAYGSAHRRRRYLGSYASEAEAGRAVAAWRRENGVESFAWGST